MNDVTSSFLLQSSRRCIGLQFSVLFFLLWTQATQAQRDARFTQIGGPDRALLNMLRREIWVKSSWECAKKCLEDDYCFSYNLQDTAARRQPRICQLNIDTAEESGKDLSYQPGFKYYAQVSGHRAVNPAGCIQALAYDDDKGFLYMAFSGLVHLFPNVQTAMISNDTFTMPGDIVGMVALPSGDPATSLFTLFLADGSVMNSTLDISAHTWTSDPAVSTQSTYGNHVPSNIDAAVEIGGTLYLIADNRVYEAWGSEWGIRETSPSNILSSAPLDITSAADMVGLSTWIFKGTRLYQYSWASKTVLMGQVAMG